MQPTLQFYGGDLYVGVMTVINSIREVVFMPISGTTQGSLPVMGYNYGARDYARVRQCIKFITKLCVVYATLACIFLPLLPGADDPDFQRRPGVDPGRRAVRADLLVLLFYDVAANGGAEHVLALGRSKQAIFFSLLRKAIIVVPLVYLLPRIGGLGVDGVFLSEPISDVIGGSACFITMMCTVWRELVAKEKAARESLPETGADTELPKKRDIKKALRFPEKRGALTLKLFSEGEEFCGFAVVHDGGPSVRQAVTAGGIERACRRVVGRRVDGCPALPTRAQEVLRKTHGVASGAAPPLFGRDDKHTDPRAVAAAETVYAQPGDGLRVSCDQEVLLVWVLRGQYVPPFAVWYRAECSARQTHTSDIRRARNAA